jgi:pimeloyl-ACP methyl ester carboxylesterase
MRKGYTDGPFGQIHWRMMDAVGEATMPDLYCLHPSPFSGLAYTNVMPMLAQNRRVIAPDYPGYGGSDPFKAHPYKVHPFKVHPFGAHPFEALSSLAAMLSASKA